MVRKQLARQEIITPPETANQLGQRDLLASMTENVLRSKTTNRHTAFKITIRDDY